MVGTASIKIKQDSDAKQQQVDIDARKTLRNIRNLEKENLPARDVVKAIAYPVDLEPPKRLKMAQPPTNVKPPVPASDGCSASDLTDAEPSENYYKTLAETRLVALQETLKENEQLYQRIAELEEKLEVYTQIVTVTQSLIGNLQHTLEEPTEQGSSDASDTDNEEEAGDGDKDEEKASSSN